MSGSEQTHVVRMFGLNSDDNDHLMMTPLRARRSCQTVPPSSPLAAGDHGKKKSLTASGSNESQDESEYKVIWASNEQGPCRKEPSNIDLSAEGAIQHIDQRNCDRYRQFIAQEIRQNFYPNKPFSDQLHSSRVRKGAKWHRYRLYITEWPEFSRVDWDVATAYHRAKPPKTGDRVKLQYILQNARDHFDWPEIVDDQNVGRVISEYRKDSCRHDTPTQHDDEDAENDIPLRITRKNAIDWKRKPGHHVSRLGSAVLSNSAQARGVDKESGGTHSFRSALLSEPGASPVLEDDRVPTTTASFIPRLLSSEPIDTHRPSPRRLTNGTPGTRLPENEDQCNRAIDIDPRQDEEQRSIPWDGELLHDQRVKKTTQQAMELLANRTPGKYPSSSVTQGAVDSDSVSESRSVDPDFSQQQRQHHVEPIRALGTDLKRLVDMLVATHDRQLVELRKKFRETEIRVKAAERENRSLRQEVEHFRSTEENQRKRRAEEDLESEQLKRIMTEVEKLTQLRSGN